MKIQLPENIVTAIRTFRKIAFAIWIGMVVYLIVISFHYLFGFDAVKSHGIGIIMGLLVFVGTIAILAKKYGWGNKIEILEKD